MSLNFVPIDNKLPLAQVKPCRRTDDESLPEQMMTKVISKPQFVSYCGDLV